MAKKYWLLIIIGGITLMSYRMTRGIRNNNPGNIKYDPKNAWQGQIGDDGIFSIFDTMTNGIRALVITLRTYFNAYGYNTIRKIINYYAPGSENDTEAYIDSVSQTMGVSPDAILVFPDDLPKLVRAIIKQENGVTNYLISDAAIFKGIDAAA
jgi:hypothetical protein